MSRPRQLREVGSIGRAGHSFFGGYSPRLLHVERIDGGFEGSVQLPNDDFFAGAGSFRQGTIAECLMEIGPSLQDFDAYRCLLPYRQSLRTRKKRRLSWHLSKPVLSDLAEPGVPTEQLWTYLLAKTPHGTPVAHMLLLLEVSLQDIELRERPKKNRDGALDVTFGVSVVEHFVRPRYRTAGVQAALGYVGAVLASDALDHLLLTLPKYSVLESFVAGDDRSELTHVPPGEYLMDEFWSQVRSRIAPKGQRRFRGITLRQVESFLE